MHLLFCLDYYYPHLGGAEVLFTGLAEGLVREGAIANIRSIIEQSAGRGMKTMDSDLMRLYKDGVITASEAFMKATNKQDFEPFLTKEDMQAIRS